MKHVLLVLLFLGIGCSGGESPEVGRIVLIGVDAADPEVIATLRARGELPAFDRLLREGAALDLAVDEPIFSPRIWTSIFTGFTPEHHGIESFTLPSGGKRVPVTSNLVKRRWVWDILGEVGIDVGVVGHWVTWPAQPVNGFLLSNYTWPPSRDFEKEWEPDAAWDSIGARTWPEGLDLAVEDAVREGRYFSAGDFPYVDRLDPALRHYLDKDLAFMNAGIALFDEREPRFFTLYVEGTDFFPHKLWLYHKYFEKVRHGGSMEGLPEPEKAPPANVVEAFGPMVARTYHLADRLLGMVLERIDLSRDVVIVVSDHGFRTYEEGTEIHAGDDVYTELPFWHSETGILYAAGPPFRKGYSGGSACPEDVTPLVLTAFGLPVGEDMDGEAPREIFLDGFWKDHPSATIKTYETDDARDNEEPIQSPVDDEIREKLKALGYIN